jgi:hypothetical protein
MRSDAFGREQAEKICRILLGSPVAFYMSMEEFFKRMSKNIQDDCQVLTRRDLNLIEAVKELQVDVAWIKKLLFLILGIVLANLGAFILRTAP